MKQPLDRFNQEGTKAHEPSSFIEQFTILHENDCTNFSKNLKELVSHHRCNLMEFSTNFQYRPYPIIFWKWLIGLDPFLLNGVQFLFLFIYLTYLFFS